jgi:hypothetical protein
MTEQFPGLEVLRSTMFDLDRLDDFEKTYLETIESISLNIPKLKAARTLLIEQIEWLKAQRVEGEA